MKKPSFVVIAVVAIVGAAAFASAFVWVASPSSSSTSREAPARQCDPNDYVLFGHVKSLAPRGDAFELQFDPAWFTSGLTASRAKLEDTGYGDVPNDNYVVDEGHRLLTYVLPAAAHITVLTAGNPDGGPFPARAITPAQLADLVAGKKPVKLWEGLETGFWMNVHIDTVCSLNQQYRP
ncbi:MAG: hypothetical protein AABM30_10375 [Actinomycetota bacterium]